MFLRKLDALAEEWGKKSDDMQEIQKESLLYAMRLKTTPTGLKNALRKEQLDTKVATPMWSGNAYLLLKLPEVLTNPKSKIPCLEDFLYARKVLGQKQIGTLKRKIKSIPNTIDREKFLSSMMPLMRSKAYCARFLSMLDPSVEKGDIQQDLAVEMLKIVNKELTNLKTKDKEAIERYFKNCFNQKAKTYVGKKKIKNFRVTVENDAEMEALIQSQQVEEVQWATRLADPIVQRDLRDMLTWEQAEAFWLLMGLPGADRADEFAAFLTEQKLNREQIPIGQLKRQIQRFLDAPDVFDELMEHPDMRGYFQAL